ncbi:MAG: M20/M25/M40 family metallo-hydrolase [Gammaproteobacteria bacterium]|nr:M20/M25/M40 family metallo-hydrolase [Gammaproteobacteria bacterium]
MPHPRAEEVCRQALGRIQATVDKLKDYLRHPAISCDPDHHGDVRRLAAAIRDDLERVGLSRARLLELDGALPCVAAEHLGAGDDRPCVLIYGHLDLQPVKGEPWATPPHEATEIEGRLYARGSGDDMGGWVSHLAAIESWLEVAGELPCNVRLIIEGEEEIGSPNLERFMDAYPDAFDADVMVLTDCENPSTDVPGLTVSLRGLLELEVTCEALQSDVHSGLWGNVAPDVSTALVRAISRVLDDDGRLAVGRVEVPGEWRRAAESVDLAEAVVREGAHLLDGVRPLPRRDRPLIEWAWRQPAVTILSTTLPSPGGEKNALRARASAVLSIRVAPDQTVEEVRDEIIGILTERPPGGVCMKVEQRPARADPWLYEPEGPAFEAADRAYRKAWGHGLVEVGIGGSIPFVALFGRRFGHLPLILNGVLDPSSSIHGPNESMDLGVFEKAIAANVFLLDELGALPELIGRRSD